MKAIQIISQDLFDKVRSRFSNLEMGNEDGGVTIDPAEARFFDFDFIINEENLGRVSISLNDPGTLKVYYSQGIMENREDQTKQIWYQFLKEMRFFAMRRLLRFDTRDIAKDNLDKNDFQYLATNKPKEEDSMKSTMNESRWTPRSSRKTSRAVKGRTEVIVRHESAVNEMLPADRSRPGNIKAIFIQNADGERFKAPFNYLPLAFALAQHIDHGGVPHDTAAKKMIGMCEEIAKLQEFKKKIKSPTLHQDALAITDKAMGRLNELKTTLEALGKRRHYESWIAEVNETENLDDDLMELTPTQMEEYKSKFTQTNFNEDLVEYFPLIHSIMQEKIDLQDYIAELQEPKIFSQYPEYEATVRPIWNILNKVHRKEKLSQDEMHTLIDKENFINKLILKSEIPRELSMAIKPMFISIKRQLAMKEQQPGMQFEQWAESVEMGLFNRDELNKKLNNTTLTNELADLELGPEGSVAWEKLKSLFDLNEMDPDDEALQKQLELKAKTARQEEEKGINGPAMDVFKSWVEDFPGKIKDSWKQGLPELFPPTQPQDQPQLTPEPETGMQPAPAPEPGVNTNPTPGPETGMNPAPRPVAEGSESLMREVAETVKQFYNADNEEAAPFRSEEAVCLEVEKTIGEKYGDDAGKRAGLIAKKFMEKLTKQWEMKHNKNKEELAPPIEDDGLARIQELIGKVKSKVESIDQTDEGTMADLKNRLSGVVKGVADKVASGARTVADKVASGARTVANVVAPDDQRLIKDFEDETGGKAPPHVRQRLGITDTDSSTNEMAEILKLSGLKR